MYSLLKEKAIMKFPLKIRLYFITMHLEHEFGCFFKVEYINNSLLRIKYSDDNLNNMKDFLEKVFHISNKYLKYEENWNLELG